MTKFKDINDLRNWVKNHENDGQVNGIPVVQNSTVEIRGGFIPGHLYDRVLLISASLGFNKSDTGKAAIILLRNRWASRHVSELKERILLIEKEDFRSEFRYFLPLELRYSMEHLLNEPIWGRLGAMFVTAIALANWCDENAGYYQEWIENKVRETGLTQQEIETKIFDLWRIEQSTKRLAQSEKKGYLVKDTKLA